MSTRHHWLKSLTCIPCGATGAAEMFQNAGPPFQTPAPIECVIGGGFRQVADELDQFECALCGGPAEAGAGT